MTNTAKAGVAATFLFIAALTLARCDKASAEGFVVMGPGGTAIVAPLGSAETRMIQVQPDLSVETQERIRRWEVFCNPTPVPDRYGVERLRYDHPGCEFGRDH